MVQLDKNDPVHVLDSYNLKIILGELDTFYDFTTYIEAKEAAIKEATSIMNAATQSALKTKDNAIAQAQKNTNEKMFPFFLCNYHDDCYIYSSTNTN